MARPYKFGSFKFFRQTLLRGDPSDITEMFNVMKKNRKDMEKEIANIAFYMQGGISYSDAYLLSSDQRLLLSKIIEKHYDAMSGKKGSGNFIG